MKTLAASLSILTKQGVMLYLLRGVAFTCIISVLGVIMGLIVGSLLALARTYCKKGPSRILGWFATAYIELFRNTPLMLWMFVCFVMCPAPAVSKSFAEMLGMSSTVAVKTLFKAIAALTLFTSAIMAEIIRGGLNSVAKGQFEAAYSQGFGMMQTMTLIVLPQALRTAVPALSNSLIGMIKDTSLASNITVAELFMAGQRVAARTYIFLPIYCEVAVVYLLFCTVITKLQALLERRLNAHGFQ